MFALDTNAVIHLMKGQGRVRERLAAIPPDEIMIPAVVLYELEWGTLRAQDPERRRWQLAQIFDSDQIIAFNEAAARAAARIRHELERSGLTIGPHDLLIAGSAVSVGAILVTHNREEFSRVPGLLTEDWY